MIKFGECVVCAENCCWIVADGDLYEKEVCSHAHLEYLEMFGGLLAQQAVSQSTQQSNAAELPTESHYDRMDTAEIFGYDGDHWD